MKIKENAMKYLTRELKIAMGYKGNGKNNCDMCSQNDHQKFD